MIVADVLEKLKLMNPNATVYIDSVNRGFKEIETIESFPHYTTMHKMGCDRFCCECEVIPDGNYIVLNKIKRRGKMK